MNQALRARMFKVVTAITFARLPMMLAFIVLAMVNLAVGSKVIDWINMSLLIVAALTDLFDGALARKYKVQTEFGAFADPLMDKVYYAVSLPVITFLALANGHVLHGQIMLIFTVTFLVRDQWVSFLRSVGSKYNADVKANWSGKLRTLISFPVICFAYGFEINVPLWTWMIYGMEATCLILNLISTLVYTKEYWPYLRRAATLRDVDE